MHPLRHRRPAACLLLAAFALALVAGMAAPWLRAAPAVERVCSASGEVRWLLRSGELAVAPDDDPGHHTLECALCLPPLLPPLQTAWLPPAAPPAAGRVLIPPAPRHRPPLSRAPFPARAPPAAAAAPLLA